VTRARAAWPKVCVRVRGDGGFGEPTPYQVSERLEITHTFGLSTDPVLQRAGEGLLAGAVRVWGEARRPQRLFHGPALPVGGLLAAGRRAAAGPGAHLGPVVGRVDDDGVVCDAEAVGSLQRLADVIVVGVARPAGRPWQCLGGPGRSGRPLTLRYPNTQPGASTHEVRLCGWPPPLPSSQPHRRRARLSASPGALPRKGSAGRRLWSARGPGATAPHRRPGGNRGGVAPQATGGPGVAAKRHGATANRKVDASITCGASLYPLAADTRGGGPR
jgi:hypothetical protein